MPKLNNYCVRYLYRENGELQTKVDIYENQSTPFTKMRLNCKRIADQNKWRLLDVTRLA